MAVIKHHKHVAALPGTLEANSVYYVRTGAGFDIYVTNDSGLVVAYPLNVGGAGQGFFRTEPISATATGQTVFTVPGGYTPGAVIVSLNGASLPPADYTATDGATVVLASGDGIVVGSVLLVHVLSAFEVADALPLNGTAKDSERFAGLLPPPEDGKQYALKDGAWVEVQAGGGSWGSITGTLADQADLASALNAKAAASDIDFTIIYPNGGSEASPATLSSNTRYIEANPFPGHRVLCVSEIYAFGEWGVSAYDGESTTNAIGVSAAQHNDASIVIRTGSTFKSGNNWQFNTFNNSTVVSTAPCRVKVWKLKGAIA